MSEKTNIQWRTIPGWLEYEVSENGTVRRACGGKGAVVHRILKAWVNPQNDYFCVALWKNNKRQQIPVHRLVAMAFLGLPPFPCAEVAHNDGSRQNNHYTNLRWDSHAGNMQDTLKHETHNRGDKNGQSILTESQIREAKRLLAQGFLQRHIAAYFGVSRQHISDIKNGRRWGWLNEAS